MAEEFGDRSIINTSSLEPDLEIGIGSNIIMAHPGDEISLEVWLSYEFPWSVSSYFVPITFDTDFKNELDVISFEELPPPAPLSNLTVGIESSQESTGAQIGQLFDFEGTTVGSGPLGPLDILIARITFRVNDNVQSDGFDIFPDFSAGGGIVIFVRHYDNISRLMSGSEKPVNEAGRPTRARTRHS